MLWSPVSRAFCRSINIPQAIYLPLRACLMFSVILIQVWYVENVCFKVWLSPSKKNCVICLIESPLKMMKNAFYFILKGLSVLKTFRSCRKNGLIRKIRLTSKLMMSQPGLKTIVMHILPNISQSKGNQTIKFGKLIQYNRNIFLKKLSRKWGKETSSRPFLFFKKA